MNISKASALLVLSCTFTANAADHGPQAVGCDYRLGRKHGSGTCLIVGSGTNQGVSWTVFEVDGRRYRYQDNEPQTIVVVDSKGRELKRLKGENSSAPCRPGGKEADVYSFSNGDRVCLYW
mgnify:FL=1